MIFLLDADRNGTDSIQRRIDAGNVTLLNCGSFVDYDTHCRMLADRKAQPGDLVILDTYTSLLASTRGDFKHGSDPTASVWENHKLYFGDKQAMNSYQAAGNMVMRWLKNLRNCGYRIVVLAHEDEYEVPGAFEKEFSIKANQEARDMLIAASSDIFRLVSFPEGQTEPDGDGGVRVILDKDERVLMLRRTKNSLIKFHVDLEQSPKIPPGIKAPTMSKLREVLGKDPSFVVIYSAPGVGKTTLATSDAA